MPNYVRRSLLLVFLCSVCFAQATQPSITLDESQYFRFMLMNLASLDHHSEMVKAYEDSIVKQFGLNTEESAAIRGAAQILHGLLVQLRQSSQAVKAGKTTLSPADAAAMAALREQREQLIFNLTNQILAAVRPDTAMRLKHPGAMVAAALKNAAGGK